MLVFLLIIPRLPVRLVQVRIDKDHTEVACLSLTRKTYCFRQVYTQNLTLFRLNSSLLFDRDF